ncbi:MAG: hypothetical protein ABSF27_04110 [Candidatus Dormibacteria bacterium]
MPDLGGAPTDRIRALDAVTSDTRSLLRRAVRIREQTSNLEDPELAALGAELVELAERLLARLEDRRAEERRRARRQLRGGREETDDL